MRALFLACAAPFATACTTFSGEDHVLVTSEPLGARILVDGVDTGATTPARLPIGGIVGGDHEIALVKEGYRTARRRVVHHTEGYTSKWIDGAYEDVLPPLPFFWTGGDFLFPFAVRGAIVPHELHCRLYPEGSPLLGFELLSRGEGSAPRLGP